MSSFLDKSTSQSSVPGNASTETLSPSSPPLPTLLPLHCDGHHGHVHGHMHLAQSLAQALHS